MPLELTQQRAASFGELDCSLKAVALSPEKDKQLRVCLFAVHVLTQRSVIYLFCYKQPG